MLKEAGVPDKLQDRRNVPSLPHLRVWTHIRRSAPHLLGWDVDSRIVEVQAFIEQRTKGQFQLTVGGLGMLVNDPHDIIGGVYQKDSAYNIHHWTHPRIEEIYDLRPESWTEQSEGP